MHAYLRQTVFGITWVALIGLWQSGCSDKHDEARTSLSLIERKVISSGGTSTRVAPTLHAAMSDREIAAALSQWDSQDSEACRQWIEAETSENPRLAARHARLLLRTMSADAYAERAALAQRFPDNEGLLTEVSATWAERAPIEALEWLAGLEEGRAVLAAMEIAIRRWAENDAEAASRFLLEMPRGAKRDAAINALSASIAGVDIVSARTWAQSIDDESTRERLCSTLDALSTGL